MHSKTLSAILILAVLGAGCDSSSTPAEPQGQPIPPPGPHFLVPPIPLEKIARITPLGHNNKILPLGHTYWDTCDYGLSGRPCLLEQSPVMSPGNGIILSLSPGDGHVSIEGPPGLIATFQHVTPIAGLFAGDSVHAGDVVATMYYAHSFDFGLINFGIEPHYFVNPDRMTPGYLHAESPLAQFPEPLRSALFGRVVTQSDPLGRISYDVLGTASGVWFKEGSPNSDLVFTPEYTHTQLFLGQLAERDDARIVVTGDGWGGTLRRIGLAEADTPPWTEVTPAAGPVQVKLWGIGPDLQISVSQPLGSVLVEVLTDRTLRIEWFATHDPVSGFTAAARTYER